MYLLVDATSSGPSFQGSGCDLASVASLVTGSVMGKAVFEARSSSRLQRMVDCPRRRIHPDGFGELSAPAGVPDSQGRKVRQPRMETLTKRWKTMWGVQGSICHLLLQSKASLFLDTSVVHRHETARIANSAQVQSSAQ